MLVEQLWPGMKREKVIPHTNRWRLRLDTGCDGEEVGKIFYNNTLKMYLTISFISFFLDIVIISLWELFGHDNHGVKIRLF